MIVACPECGVAQRIAPLPERAAAECWRCETTLERTAGRSAGAALALTLAALLLFIPGNVLPVMRSNLLGSSMDARVADSVFAFVLDGRPLVAAFLAIFVIAVPLLRAALLIGVLGGLRLGYRELWQGRLFRYAENLRHWSMPEVYVLAGAVTYSRVAAQLDVEVLPGGWCFVVAAFFLLIAETSLDRRRVWLAIRPDEPIPEGLDGARTFGCDSCDLVLPVERAGDSCPRCANRLFLRKPRAFPRAVALTLAALLLLYPAYFLPMTQAVQPNGYVEHTVPDGVRQLFERGFWYLGVLVLVVSIGIPLVKVAALIWMTASVRFPHRTGLRLRVRMHRTIDEINRWSFVDPFIVAVTAPMMAYPGIASVHAGPGTLPFALVVVLTMLASRVFDPRLMWDAAEQRHGQRR